MSNMVGTVLSGFEYRAQKEKYDHLYKFLDDNKEKYQYTGFTKEAINKTQKYRLPKYYYLVGDIPTLKEYRKYYEPLINKMKKILNKALNMLIMLLNTKEK